MIEIAKHICNVAVLACWIGGVALLWHITLLLAVAINKQKE